MRYFLQIAYDGTNYHGWQVQPNAVTVQQVLSEKLGQVLSNPEVETMGCGRTDTGVHASQFYVHFDSARELDEYRLVFGLNNMLPPDISVSRLLPVAGDAHARFDATSRTYKYRIHSQKDAFIERWSMRFSRALNVDAMNDCCQLLLGERDFGCFAKSGADTKTNFCNISVAEWLAVDSGYEFTVSANRFLRNMVRAIVGTLMEAGQGKMSKEQFADILQRGDRSEAGKSVEARGLHLVDVQYPYLT